MGLPQLTSCCCGCTLRAGSLILLWLYVIGSIIILWSIAMFAEMEKALAGPWYTPVLDPSSYWLVLLIVGITTAICIASLHGVYEDLHSFMIPFLSLNGIVVVLQTIGFLLSVISLQTQAPENKMSDDTAKSLAREIIAAFICLALNSYFWLVVYSHYRALKRSSSSWNTF